MDWWQLYQLLGSFLCHHLAQHLWAKWLYHYQQHLAPPMEHAICIQMNFLGNPKYHFELKLFYEWQFTLSLTSLNRKRSVSISYWLPTRLIFKTGTPIWRKYGSKTSVTVIPSISRRSGSFGLSATALSQKERSSSHFAVLNCKLHLIES